MSDLALATLHAQHPDCGFLAELRKHWHIVEEIYAACGGRHETGCGSYLFDGQQYVYYAGMYEKQKLLYEQAKRAVRVLEVGVYMGHSLLLMLLANPRMHITAIDISDTFAGPAISVLQKHFPDATIKFHHGDSLACLPMLSDTFDLFHIDGCHTEDYVLFDFYNCIARAMIGRNAVFVFDDYDVYAPTVNRLASYTSGRHRGKGVVVVPSCAWRNAIVEFEAVAAVGTA